MSNMMKKLRLMLALAMLTAPLGCGGSSGGGPGTTPTALTENDFVNDPSCRTTFQSLVVTFLEHPNGQTPAYDTDQVGIDVIPYICAEPGVHRFCMEDDNSGAQHYMYLEDATGNEVLRVYSNGACASATLQAGLYTMWLVHDGITSGSQAVFIRPDSSAASREIQSAAGASEDYSQDDFRTLLRSHRCEHCDLNSADLRNAVLSVAILHRADLTGATWTDGRTCAQGSIGQCK